jgi:hypothetical protein
MQHLVTEVMQNTMAFSQPVFGPTIGTSGDYSREGYASTTFAKPRVAFRKLALILEEDEDARFAMNHLTSLVTGGAHYWKAKTDEYGDYLNKFSKDIDFDWLDTLMVQESLWYGNTAWKPRLGIGHIRNKDDLMWLPISSLRRIWWDRQRQPYVYEFRGPQYQGYHQVSKYFNTDIKGTDVIHIVWNPVDASPFGTGLGQALAIEREYKVQTVNGLEDRKSTSLMDQKVETRHNMLQSQRRYIPRNVYSIPEGEDADVTALRSDLQELEPQEDVVSGNKIEVQELGSIQKGFDPTLHNDLVQGPIMKSLGTTVGKQAGESSHTYANAETAAELEQIGLSSFPLAIARQLQDKLFKPWYDANPMYDPMYYQGMIALQWDDIEPELNFGRQEKKTVDTDQAIKLLEIAMQMGALPDPVEGRQILSDLGLPLKQKFTDQINAAYNNYQVVPPYMNQQQQQQLSWDTTQADQAPRPMDTAPPYSPDANYPHPSYPHPMPDGQPVITAHPSAQITPGVDSMPSDPRLNHDAVSRIRDTK